MRCVSVLVALCLLGVAFATPEPQFAMTVEPGQQVCGDSGNICDARHTCVTTEVNAGAMYGCSPLPEATICSDTRFSCPAHLACELAAFSACVDPVTRAHVQPVSENLNAVRHRHVSGTDTVCALVLPYIPSFCACKETGTNYGGIVSCAVDFLDVDTITVLVNLEPCANPMYVNIEIQESALGIDYKLFELKAGTSEKVPVPGLNLDIPFLGNVGVECIVYLGGSLSSFQIKIGIDGCLVIVDEEGNPTTDPAALEGAAGFSECGADLTKLLPIWLFDTTIDFDDVCAITRIDEIPALMIE